MSGATGAAFDDHEFGAKQERSGLLLGFFEEGGIGASGGVFEADEDGALARAHGRCLGGDSDAGDEDFGVVPDVK